MHEAASKMHGAQKSARITLVASPSSFIRSAGVRACRVCEHCSASLRRESNNGCAVNPTAGTAAYVTISSAIFASSPPHAISGPTIFLTCFDSAVHNKKMFRGAASLI